MYRKKKTRSIIIIALVLTIILFTGCSRDVSKEELFQIKGRVEFTATPAVMAVQDLNLFHDPYRPADGERLEISSLAENIFTLPLGDASVKPREYIVKFRQEIGREYLQNEILKGKGQVLARVRENIYKISLAEENREMLIHLKENPLVSYIEPEYLVHIQAIPNDPGYVKQWNLHLLELEQVWESWQGSKEVTVAVLDTGILPGHPDLADNIVSGYDFIDDDDDPTDTNNRFSHGTHVAGIIGAISNNREGIAGINWNVSIMPVRVIGEKGTGDYSTLIQGIYWAVDNGADIINLSLAGPMDTAALREAIQYAVQQQVTVVAAAGNNGSSPILYPARYPEVISVGAVGPTKERAYYSNYGLELDLVAPGGDSSVLSGEYNTILSTAGYIHNDTAIYQYTWSQGTSMAAPHVSAAAALLYSAGLNNPQQVKKILQGTADDLGTPGTDIFYGAGLLNIKKALQYAGLPIHDSSKIQILARNMANKSERITCADPLTGTFILNLSKGTWLIEASFKEYVGEKEIFVPGDNDIDIEIQ